MIFIKQNKINEEVELPEIKLQEEHKQIKAENPIESDKEYAKKLQDIFSEGMFYTLINLISTEMEIQKNFQEKQDEEIAKKLSQKGSPKEDVSTKISKKRRKPLRRVAKKPLDYAAILEMAQLSRFFGIYN